MHITTINYTKTFNLGNYSSEKIGVEIALNEGEDAMEAMEAAKNLVHEFHQKYQLQINPEYAHLLQQPSTCEPLPTIQTSTVQPEIWEPTLAEQIASCMEVKVLESYKFIAKKDPELQLEYDKRMYILTH